MDEKSNKIEKLNLNFSKSKGKIENKSENESENENENENDNKIENEIDKDKNENINDNYSNSHLYKNTTYLNNLSYNNLNQKIVFQNPNPSGTANARAIFRAKLKAESGNGGIIR